MTSLLCSIFSVYELSETPLIDSFTTRPEDLPGARSVRGQSIPESNLKIIFNRRLFGSSLAIFYILMTGVRHSLLANFVA